MTTTPAAAYVIVVNVADNGDRDAHPYGDGSYQEIIGPFTDFDTAVTETGRLETAHLRSGNAPYGMVTFSVLFLHPPDSAGNVAANAVTLPDDGIAPGTAA